MYYVPQIVFLLLMLLSTISCVCILIFFFFKQMHVRARTSILQKCSVQVISVITIIDYC